MQRPFLDALAPEFRGQAFALRSTGLMTLQGVGPVLLGFLAERTSIGTAMVVAGAGAAAVGSWWWLTREPAEGYAASSAVVRG